ncbi:MAG: hypothetical protein J3K34DRAFT_516558 [Monoraphidium minutum]|nr:MAG: hypothetical protein J3K34DRAFT_516558 [Monoraphidium minutum]
MDPPPAACNIPPSFVSAHGLSKHQAERYSRQVILPTFGPAAQARLCGSSALIVGCGGLGAPAALYLAAAGVGRLGLVDRDVVEVSNLHRQIIHSEARAGAHKADSAAAAVAALNSSVSIDVHRGGLDRGNAVQIVSQYDVVLDASDNAPTRYLLSDACAAAGRPLVSAAAVGTDGQLTVYCHGGDGPCYRCLFPEPPAPGDCARCSDAGVLGPVPGVMGVLQALEAIKLLSGVGAPLGRTLLLFDGLAGRFTSVKLRARAPGCAACGGGREATESMPAPGGGGEAGGGPRGRMRPADVAAFDYERFTGQAAHDGPPPPLRVLPPEARLSAGELRRRLRERAAPAAAGAGSGSSGAQPGAGAAAAAAAAESSSGGGGGGGYLLVDVRPREQFESAALPGAVSAPFESPAAFRERQLPRLLALRAAAAHGGGGGAGGGDAGAGAAPDVFVLCRRGNHSQLAVEALREAGVAEAYDLIGGLQAWADEVDPGVPVL